jgi:hypothetical protein
MTERAESMTGSPPRPSADEDGEARVIELARVWRRIALDHGYHSDSAEGDAAADRTDC